ncbi:hypothetical protein HPP92_018381 [Vanilla planifolia]|uniref:COMM domain-containing protein n=1 Tax=Vanilla planifolia TaxID=51239 RepID=A0A835QHZ0_VANPL|nr:hypothetical protein HPP92_018381 [Vanilla planifolia]
MEVHPLLLHLLKLPPATTEESLASVLETLWKTRKSGLSELQKSHVQSLLNLTAPMELDAKYKNLWEEEATDDQPLSQQMRCKFPGRVNVPPACAPLADADLLSWPREDNVKPYAEPSVLQKSSVVNSVESPVCLATLPRLKSMTWAMQSRNSEPGSHITIITLKLQDYTKSHMGEVEVKFQLSRDTLEAMLRTMTCINDQLSNAGRVPQESTAKRQKN